MSNWRDEAWNRLESETLDVLVIGGGIVGAGVVRDAAMRGMRAGLVEQHDFAEGTSSRSSRLLHGGLRYLEQGRVFLVREASVEKKIVQKIAPHLVRPLGFVFPAYRGQGRPLWQLKIGVKLYDLLCSGKNFQPSRGLSVDETLKYLPGLRSEALRGSAFYFDALTNDARLVIDSLRSASRHDACLLNYTCFVNSHYQSSAWECEVVDQLTGQPRKIRARTIVNATGPWANKLPHSGVKLRLSKGIHIVVPQSRLPVQSAAVITEGKRILFVIPWGDRVIVGTTDTDFDEAPEAVRTTEEDVDYVLATLGKFFPTAAIGRSDLCSVWAGLRPLIANPNGSPSDISRAHQITSPEPHWWDVAGGKLTTYRLMAEQTVDKIAKELMQKHKPCQTDTQPLVNPGEDLFSSVDPAPFNQDAVIHYVRNEWVTHLDDVLIRRSGWLHHEPISDERLDLVALWMGECLGWDAAQIASEKSRATSIMRQQAQICDS